MALSLAYTFGAPCPGGEHVTVTASLTGAITRNDAFNVDRATLLTPVTAEEGRMVEMALLRLLIAQLANRTNANIKSVIEAKIINLTVTG